MSQMGQKRRSRPVRQVEANGWNNEQVHGGNVRRMVMQESPPSLAGWPSSFYHVLGDA
jgi:hypothetical protein